ncbi:MAG: SDR family NAD(P)-dependent oxidoreductase [Acidobacteriota bacterium]
MTRLEGRVALVTGASRGIGAATAELLAAEGAAVGVNYRRSEAAARDLVRRIGVAGGRALAVRADVRDDREVAAMVATVTREFGPIDLLVLNAAMEFPITPFLEYPWEAFEAKLVGELKAAFFPCRSVVPSMIERGGGCIVAVSSGLSRHPGEGFCAHSTAKSGLDAFAKSLALELGPKGIRVNVVAPGLTLTDATSWMPQSARDAAAARAPLRRIGLPADVAGAVLALAIDEARFLTGAYVPVSGGSQMV